MRRIIEAVHAKKNKQTNKTKLDTTLVFVDFSKPFHSIHRGKMEQTLLEYGLLIENCPSHNDAL